MVKVLVFFGVILALPVLSYFFSYTEFYSNFSAGTVDLSVERRLSRRSLKNVEVKNEGSLNFIYQLQILSTDQCNFDIRIDKGDNLFYYGRPDNYSDWRRLFLPAGDSADWTFRGFSGDEDCRVNILFRARNGFSSFDGFRFLD